MFIIRWFLSFVGFWGGDFDCSCTKLVILWLNVECVEVSSPAYEYWVIRTIRDTMIYCLYRVWRWRGLKRWITWLINQNNWVRNSRMMMFSTKILTSFVMWIKKSSKNHQKVVKKVLYVWMFCFLMILRHYSMVFDFCGNFCGFWLFLYKTSYFYGYK